MPEIGSVKSLKHICVDFVANNIDSFPKESLAIELEAIDSENVPFTFKDLPSALLEELAKALRKNGKKVYRQFLHLLVVPNLRTLDFSICTPTRDGVSHILPLAAKNCPNLTRLVISGHSYVKDYFSLIQTFTKLQILDISNTSTPDNCLNLLGSNCKELRELNARWCSVTDAGIEGLCVIGQCKSIEILNLIGTKVTSKGIIMALEHLSSLRELKHRSTVRVLAEIHQRALDQKLSDIPKFSISSIKISSFEKLNSNSNLWSALLLCPSITEIVLIHCNLKNCTDKDLLGLLPLEKLEKFTLCGYYDNGNKHVNLTFEGGLAPFLKARGSLLKHLSLSIFQRVDYIPSIVQYCPNLLSLSLRVVSIHSVLASQQDSFRRQQNKLEQPILKYLERLELAEPNGILPESLSLLLSSPSLKLIEIRRCDVFTDDVLQKAANLHSFCNLESFEMRYCKLATIKILEILLQDNIFNHLNRIRLGWDQKAPENYSEILRNWRKEKEKNRWNVKIFLQYYEDEDTSDDDSEDEDTSDNDREGEDTSDNDREDEEISDDDSVDEETSDDDREDEEISDDDSEDENTSDDDSEDEDTSDVESEVEEYHSLHSADSEDEPNQAYICYATDEDSSDVESEDEDTSDDDSEDSSIKVATRVYYSSTETEEEEFNI